MGDPGSVTGKQYRFQRGYEPTRRRRDIDVLSPVYVQVGLAVGNNEQTAVTQLPLDVDGEPLRSPDVFCRLTQVRFRFSRGARPIEVLGDGGELPGQRLKHVELRNFLASVPTLRPQGAHPGCGLRDGAAQTPLHN